MRYSVLAFLACASNTCAQSSASSAPNLIDNGSFEENASCPYTNQSCVHYEQNFIRPWSVKGSGFFEIVRFSQFADGGNWSMDLGINASQVIIQQNLTKAVPGTTYIINFKLNASCWQITKSEQN